MFAFFLMCLPNLQTWKVTQLHFTAWEDKNEPPMREFYDFLTKYMLQVKPYKINSQFGPSVVHCR